MQRPAEAAVVDLLERSAATVRDLGRPDVAERIGLAAARLRRSGAVVAVVGPSKSGKSTLVNALFAESVCPADPIRPTRAPTVVTAGGGRRVLVRSEGEDGPLVREADPGDLEQLALGEAAADLLEVRIDSGGPIRGVTLIDLPAGAPAPGFLEIADAVLVVADPPELVDAARIAGEIRTAGPAVLPVLTKIDLYPEWRRAAADYAAALPEGSHQPLPVSAALALVEPDAADSGIEALAAVIDSRVTVPCSLLAAERGVGGVIRDLGVVAAALEQEAAALADPAVAGRRRADLDEAGRRAESLRRIGGRWQAALQEGFADLVAEADLRLRSGITGIAADVDDLVERCDPVAEWDRVSGRLAAGVGSLAAALHDDLVARTAAVAGRVAAVLGEEIAVPAAGTAFGDALPVRPGSAPAVDESGMVSRGLDMLRGTYGGVLIGGMLGHLVALPVTAPVALGAGTVFGIRHAVDQRKRRIQQRRAAVRRAVRGHLDAVHLELSGRVRRAARAAQADLRESADRRIEHLAGEYRRMASALQDGPSEAERRDRLEQVRLGIDRLAGLVREAEAMR